jgi:hypothetical protein
MEWLGSFFNGLVHDLYQLTTDATAYVIIESTIAWIKLKIFLIKFSWDTAGSILISLGFSDLLSDAFSYLPDWSRSVLVNCKFPEGLTIIAQAFCTKFVMRFLGV